MECSPTGKYRSNLESYCVAVPVNYGMLSYSLALGQLNLKHGRSPRQLWNALLLNCLYPR